MITFEQAWNVIVAAFTSLGAALLYLFQSSPEAAEKAASDAKEGLGGHKTYAAETFARKDEMRAGFDRIFDQLDEIKDRLPPKRP